MTFYVQSSQVKVFITEDPSMKVPTLHPVRPSNLRRSMIGAQKQASCNYADYSTSLDPRSTFSKPSLGLDKSASFFSTFEHIRA